MNPTVFFFFLYIACHSQCRNVGLGECIGERSDECCAWYHKNRCVRDCPMPYYVPDSVSFECEGRGKDNNY